MIRSDLKNKFPRCHFNNKKKAKRYFLSEKTALKYIERYKLIDYIAYICPYCNKWHVGIKK